MSLQRRLTLFFVLIVILPLAAAGFVVQRVVVDEIAKRARLSLGPALDATAVLYDDRAAAITEAVGAAIGPDFVRLVQGGTRSLLEAHLEELLAESETLDFLVVLDRGRDISAFGARPGRFLEGFVSPGPGEIVAAESGGGDGFIRVESPLRVAGGGPLGSVIGGFWLDQDFLVTAPEGVELSVVSGDRVIASTAPLGSTVPLEADQDGLFEADLGGEGPAEARALPDGGMTLVASTRSTDIERLASGLQLTLGGLLLLALVGTAVLAYVLSRLITQPLEELARGANAIAEGDFG
ncbi:MAG: hypothetical protein ABR575_01660 [Actinomycetota bacterium]